MTATLMDELLANDKRPAGRGFTNRTTELVDGAVLATSSTRYTRAGQYVRLQSTVQPSMIDELDKAARSLGVSRAEMIRWCLGRGLSALEDGEQPKIVETTTVRLERP